MDLDVDVKRRIAERLVESLDGSVAIYDLGPPDAEGRRSIWFYRHRQGTTQHLIGVVRLDSDGFPILLEEKSLST